MSAGIVDDALRTDLERVAAARVLFGHQSVGRNLLDGLVDLEREAGRRVLDIRDLDSPAASRQAGVLLHAAIGRNGDPASKCAHFGRLVAERHAGLDVALFKFCYVDIDDTVDVDVVFGAYERTLLELKQRYPALRFVHVTVPLRTVDSGPGVWLRERLGRRNRAKHANAARCRYNRRLRERFAADPIFDLARISATRPDGRPQEFQLDGQSCESLVPAYTDDGGHLNEAGRMVAAAGLVRAIAAALAGRAGGRGV